MKTLVLIIASFLSVFTSLSQNNVLIVDTVDFGGRQVIRFSDYSWQYLDNLEDVDLESYLPDVEANDLSKVDTTFWYSTNWNNHVTYQHNVNLSKMVDTFKVHLSAFYNEKAVWPCEGTITSTFKQRWGKWHKGIDVGATIGTTVKSTWSGKVRYAKYNQGGFGNLVIVRHANGLETYYGHLSSIAVKPNEYVRPGQVIGKVGNTGHSTGPHLHYEIRFYDNAFNPETVWDIKKRVTKHDYIDITSALFYYKHKSGGDVSVEKLTGSDSNAKETKVKLGDGTSSGRRRRNPNGYYGTMGTENDDNN